MFQKKKKQENDLFENVDNMANVFLPDMLEEKNDYLVLGNNKYVRTFVMTVFPEATYVGWLNDLSFIGNINISVKVEPSYTGNVINQLTKKLVQAKSEYATYSRQGNILHLPVLTKQIQDLEELRMLIQTNQDKLFFTTIYISINCESLVELNEKTKLLDTELNRKTSMIRTLIFKQIDGFKEILPVNTDNINGYDRNMVAGGIATVIPISNPNITHTDGAFIGKNYFTNSPVYINTFIGPPLLPNPHVFICGTSGSGKSVALKLLTARNVITNGASAFFIDVEGEYSNLTKQLGGKVIKIEQGKSAGINPFELEVEYNGKKEFVNLQDKVTEIMDLIKTMLKNHMNTDLNSLEISEIEIVVNHLYKERGISEDASSLYERKGGKLENGKFVVGKIKKKMPTLTDFYNEIMKRNICVDLARKITPFLKGNSLGNFDTESTINSNDDIICFDMSEIKGEFTKLYSSFVVLSWVWQKFILKNREKKKIIVCDEAWLFLKYKESADFLVNVARRGRKYNVPLFIGSQFIDEFINSEEGKTIINICSTKYIFKQNSSSVNEVVDFFHLAEGTKNFLISSSPGECIMSLNNSITAIKFEVADFEKEIVFT